MITKTEKAVAAVFTLLVALATLAWFSIEPAYGHAKVTICHATSSETNPFVTITISEHAVYGPGGHFNENGTTQAGHEQDYFGPCQGDETTPDETTPDETTPEPRVCPDGLPPTPGEQAYDPNDDCKRPPTTPEEPSSTPEPETPPVSPEPEVEEPSEEQEPSGSNPPKVVDVKPGTQPGTVIITTEDGDQYVGVQGSG